MDIMVPRYSGKPTSLLPGGGSNTRAGRLPRAARLEAVPGRTAAANFTCGLRAPDHTGGARGVLIVCPLVGRLRHRGDPARAGRGGGVRPEQRTILLGPADLAGYCHSALAGNL